MKQGGDLAPVCLCRASAGNSPGATGPVVEGMARRLVWREPGGQDRKRDVRWSPCRASAGLGGWGSEQGMEKTGLVFYKCLPGCGGQGRMQAGRSVGMELVRWMRAGV